MQVKKVKKFALLNSKVKRISIDTTDGKSHKLYARVEEKDFPYHRDNFNAFIEKYAKQIVITDSYMENWGLAGKQVGGVEGQNEKRISSRRRQRDK